MNKYTYLGLYIILFLSKNDKIRYILQAYVIILLWILGKELNFLINQHLGTTDYKTECVLYMSLDDDIMGAVNEYTKTLRESL